MELVINKCCLLYLFMIVLKQCVSSASSTDIQIYINNHADSYSKSEYIMDPDETIILSCTSSKPVTWNYTRPNITGENVTENWTISVDESYSSGQYESTLVLSAAFYTNTGYYNCQYKDSDECTEDKCKMLYIYVADKTHLFVPMPQDHNFRVVYFGVDFVIPCRPTSPDVVVALEKEGVVDEPLELHEKHYDPKVGFTVQVLGDAVQYNLKMKTEFFCTFDKGGVEEGEVYLYDLRKMPKFINKPFVYDLSSGHTTVGEMLQLNCTVYNDVPTRFNWILPNPDAKYHVGNISHITQSKEVFTVYSILYVYNVNEKDRGTYICNVTDGINYNASFVDVTIHDVGYHYLKLFEDNELYTINQKAGEPVQWRITIESHPINDMRIEWRDNENKIITDEVQNKYKITSSDSWTVLKINRATIADSGNFTLKVSNGLDEKTLEVTLNVEDVPQVYIHMPPYPQYGSYVNVSCTVTANPEPDIVWFWKDCLDRNCSYKQTNYTGKFKRLNRLKYVTYKEIKAESVGMLKCKATNNEGESSKQQGFFVSEFIGGFNVKIDGDVFQNSSDVTYIALGEKLELTCGASKFNYSSVNWYKNNNLIESNDAFNIERGSNELSTKTTLVINKINENHSGIYECLATGKPPNPVQRRVITIRAVEGHPPIPSSFPLKTNYELEFPDPIELKCEFSGMPVPKVHWLKNGQKVFDDNERIFLSDSGETLSFTRTVMDDEGAYTCVGENTVDGVPRSAEQYTRIVFTNKPSLLYLYILIGALLIIVLIFGIILAVYYIKNKKINDKLRMLGLENFEKGKVDCINPDMDIGEQAELLPYDKKWEFPKDKLKLGKQLGCGAFGVVVKAIAQGIEQGESNTTVAVKMVRSSTSDPTYIRALASELKIMAHLGKHPNIVNLLGACTKNVAERELYVIVEYCHYGNLQNYLIRHRDKFINQIEKSTGQFNFNINSPTTDRHMSFSSNRSTSSKPRSPFRTDFSFFKRSESGGHDNGAMEDYRAYYDGGHVNNTNNTEMTTISITPSGADPEDITRSMSNASNADQPDWRSNYRGDYRDNDTTLSSKDLLTWSYHVAKGMEYLASRKVLHGDLAARNILLNEHNVVKICDFGLAKNMYKSGNYKKKNSGPLPIKWMAIESISDQIFSTQSDVWSYGIVLWEFFSLGRTPYPGMAANEDLYNKLLDGYRMEKPNYATEILYKIMLNCWRKHPLERPPFEALAENIGEILRECDKTYYIDVNDPYLVMNMSKVEGAEDEPKTDYLQMCAPPDFAVISSPLPATNSYVNINVQPPDLPLNGYTTMQPAQIFSPRKDEIAERVFTFASTAPDNQRPQRPADLELQPMLSARSGSASPSPAGPDDSFTNPSYLIMGGNSDGNNKKSFVGDGNYVNVSSDNNKYIQNVNKLNSSIDKDLNQKHYVNNSTRDWDRVEL